MRSAPRSFYPAMIRNLLARRLDRSWIGRTLEREAPPLEETLVRDYVEATADDNPRYAGPEAILPPLLVSRLAYPLVMDVLADPSLKMNLLRMVHAEQSLIWRDVLRRGDHLRGRLLVSDIRDTRAGELLELRCSVLRGEREVAEAVSGFLVRGDRRPERAAEPPAPPPEAFRLEIPTTREQPRLYAAASGDRNPIHVSWIAARLAGLPRPILHGMCLFAMTAAALAGRLADGDPGRLTRLRGRFSRPVLPGDTLTLVAYRDEHSDEIPFAVFDPRGRPVLKDGAAALRS
jgi:acyl dehydratase